MKNTITTTLEELIAKKDRGEINTPVDVANEETVTLPDDFWSDAKVREGFKKELKDV